jgi:hypothetical protein
VLGRGGGREIWSHVREEIFPRMPCLEEEEEEEEEERIWREEQESRGMTSRCGVATQAEADSG